MYSIVIVLYSGVSECVEAEGVGMTDAGMAVMAHLVRGGRCQEAALLSGFPAPP